jgi:hypothetical protein
VSYRLNESRIDRQIVKKCNVCREKWTFCELPPDKKKKKKRSNNHRLNFLFTLPMVEGRISEKGTLCVTRLVCSCVWSSRHDEAVVDVERGYQ